MTAEPDEVEVRRRATVERRKAERDAEADAWRAARHAVAEALVARLTEVWPAELRAIRGFVAAGNFEEAERLLKYLGRDAAEQAGRIAEL